MVGNAYFRTGFLDCSVAMAFPSTAALAGRPADEFNSCPTPFALSKHTQQCLLLNIGEEVAVTAPLFFGRVADEVVNDVLVHALAGQAGDERVAENVPASSAPATWTAAGIAGMQPGGPSAG